MSVRRVCGGRSDEQGVTLAHLTQHRRPEGGVLIWTDYESGGEGVVETVHGDAGLWSR